MGKLILVPVPIGNLSDITFRAIEVLKKADIIYCEDTRTTGILLKHYQIQAKRLQSYHIHNEHQKTDKFSDAIQYAEVSALVTDAGSPGISDPGYMLVRSCLQKGIEVEALPGATALIPAISVSGIPCDRFYFEGFLPVKKGRQKKLEWLSEAIFSIVLYESPHRILKLIKELEEHFGGDRQISISREISKMYEEHFRGTIAEVRSILEERQVIKGEITVVIEGKSK